MKEKILKTLNLERFDLVVEFALFFLAGFLLSFAKISGVFSPFCLAFCIAIERKNSVFAFLGGLFGLLFCANVEGLVYFFALVIGFLLKFFFKGDSSFLNLVCAMVALTVPKLFMIILVPSSFSSWIIDYCEVVFCSALTFLFSRTFKKQFKTSLVQFYDVVGLFFIGLAILISLCYFNIFDFNLGRLFSIFLVQQALLCIGIGGVCVVSLAIAIGLILFTKNFAPFAIILAISGFLTGVFSSVGRVAKLLIMNGLFFLCSIFWGGLNLSNLIELFVVSIFVAFVPLEFVEDFFSKNKLDKIKSKFHLNDELSFKLQFIACTLLDLQNSIEQCAKNFDGNSCKNMTDVYAQVVDLVCKTCGLNTFCWVKSYNEITRSFNEISDSLRTKGKIDVNALPVFLKHRCCKIKDLIDAVNFEYKDFICKKQTSRRVNEAREVAAQQFTGMAELLVEMSQEILEIERIDHEVFEVVSVIFKEESINVDGLFCFMDKFDRLIIDVYLNSLPAKEELKKIAYLISVAIDKDIEFPSITRAKSSFKLSFFEAATLKVDFSVKQASPNGNGCCGDSYDFFMDGKGFAHMLLSDGMGSGKRAAIDSLMTCFTMRKLIETGFGFNSTLKLLNLSFSIKSKEESFATIDTCTIDLYSGMVKFVKAGATASYISSGGEICEYVSTSLPIGIIQGVSFDSKEFKLKKGDAIIMVSDGATASGFDWITDQLKVILKQNSQFIAKKLLDEAKKRCNPKHKDDITVMVAKII